MSKEIKMQLFNGLRTFFLTVLKKGSTEKVKNKSANGEDLSLRFHKLDNKGRCYFINHKTPFATNGVLKSQTIENVFDFAYKMAFTSEGAHRRHRSGGDHLRTNGEIFANTFQGKIAECAACNFFYKYDNSVAPDFSIFNIGKWDTIDLNVAEKEIAIKSTKHFGQLLLLETKDWDNKGRYIPNKSQKGESFDFIVLVRIKPSFEEILKKERLLFSNHIDRDLLHTLATRDLWEYNYVGYITHTDLLEIIKRKHIVPKNGLLNGSTPMDTENYYVQAADMRDMSTFEAVF